MCGWLWDYEATPRGLEIRLFKCVLVYRLRSQDIFSAHVIPGWLGGFRLGAHPWNTVALSNRLRWTWVLVEKRGWPRFLALTPKNPAAFVREIEQAPSLASSPR